MTTIGIKTTESLFTYPLIGLDCFIVYKRSTNSLEVFSESDSILLKTIELPGEHRNMSFEEFIVLAKNFYTDLIAETNP